MKLSKVIRDLDILEKVNFDDVDVRGIASDSKKVEAGTLFVAVEGRRSDGHDYVDEAERQGASALLVEKKLDSEIPQIVVKNSAIALALAAKSYFGDPLGFDNLIGITGTNGKTSTSFLLRSILQESIGKTGIIGTVGSGSGNDLKDCVYTTPGAIELYETLAGFKRGGVNNVVMEVSSHAIDQHRVAGLKFNIVIFTNITRDHLDYHGTFKEYSETKGRLTNLLIDPRRNKSGGIVIYNFDDPGTAGIAERYGGDKISYGLDSQADIHAENIEADLEGTRFDFVCGSNNITLVLKLLGEFNVYNALAAASAAFYLGVELGGIKSGIEKVKSVPGRFQVISKSGAPKVIVDYAHTPDALENLLRFCRKLGARKIVTVFGCGGDRDRGKRPQMGRIAAKYSDKVFVTSDNPRTEPPMAIIGEVVEGFRELDIPHQIVEDRREAIRSSIEEGQEGELVIIAGKGHECVQILKENRIHFSDVEEVQEALKIRRLSSE